MYKTGGSVSWIIGVNNFRFFTNISENYTTYKYVLYIIKKVFLQLFHLCLLHKNQYENG